MEQINFKEVYQDLKVEFWGIFAPLFAIVIFHSLAVGGAIVVFSFLMFVKNDKREEAFRVLRYSLATMGVLALGVVLIGLSAVL